MASMLPSLLKIAFCIGFFVLGLVPLLVIIERRLSAWMQGRLGPNRVDLPFLGRLGGILPSGLGHPLADAIKLLFKEQTMPEGADKFLFIMGPLIVLVPPALGLVVIPFGNYIGDEPLQVANLNVGILFTLSVLSVAVYGLAFGGWASNNKYSLLGGLRASAQLISYELALGLSIIAAIMLSGTVDPRKMVDQQAQGLQYWNIFGGGDWRLAPFGILSFILFFVSALAENNRLPFDLPECEAELVGGYHTEYSGMKFSMFMMGEYVGMILMSSLMVTFFLGGWSLPGILDPKDHRPLAGILSVAIFVTKIMVLLVLYVVIRWTLPRFKYNQLMNLGWKRLVPLALANVLAIATIGALTATGGAK
jgi:NADH-quinone oxidoreductase subunit H